jgi:hypothetical protein
MSAFGYDNDASDESSSHLVKDTSSSDHTGDDTDSGPSDMDTKEDVSAVSTAKPSPNTAIMFDWDDTLLASSYLAALGYRLDTSEAATPEVDAQLRALEFTVCTLLTKALSYGHVNIVTNAETGWVQLSAQKFMPLVVPLLSRVNVISARSTFEPHHPDQPLKWKYFAFQSRLTAVFGASAPGSSASWGATGLEVTKNVVSFGDSHVEREAIRAITRGVAGCRTKSVKFAERPTAEQLRRQLELVTNCFHYIHNHDADLDLQLTVTLNSPSSPSSTSSASSPASSGTGVSAPSPVAAALPTTEVA